MFWASTVPIIRSYQLYTWHLHKTYQLLRVQLRTSDDGHSRCPKRVEFRDKIKFWILDASCWLFIRRSSEKVGKLLTGNMVSHPRRQLSLQSSPRKSQTMLQFLLSVLQAEEIRSIAISQGRIRGIGNGCLEIFNTLVSSTFISIP
jgi:hypothetical protein